MADLKRILLAVTGASGMPYAVRLAEVLERTPGISLHMIVSSAARKVLEHECGATTAVLTKRADVIHEEEDIAAGPASGSWPHDGMVICPCSMKSLACIAHGISTNLIHRAADATMKERRPLVLIPRETPLSVIHLENMTTLARAGATILPPAPGFYGRSETVADLVDFIVARILDHLSIPHSLTTPWEG